MLAKKMLFYIIVIFTVVLFGSQAYAVELTINPSASENGIGNPFSFYINIGGLENDDLSAFDFNINYDESVFLFKSYELGSELGDISLFEADDWSQGNLGGGKINIAEISWLFDLSFQPDSFTLVTLVFEGISAATDSMVTLGNDYILGDTFGEPLFLDSITNASVSVTDTAPVPEPSTFALTIIGAIFLHGIRARSRKYY